MDSSTENTPITVNSELVSLFDEKLKEFEQEYERRTALADKLDAKERWIEVLNIYYSVFTLGLGILCLKEPWEFASSTCLLFTLTLTILVIYSNGRRFNQRAVDLRSNCRDFERLKCEMRVLSTSSESVVEKEKKMMEKINTGIGLKEDSEYPVHTVLDCPLVSFFVLLILFIAPIIYVGLCFHYNHDLLIAFFKIVENSAEQVVNVGG